MEAPWILVKTQDQRARAEDDLDRAGLFAVDTEYDSFRYFREKLCLVQICVPPRTYLFDPLGKLDLSFLKKYFEHPQILKIFHAAENDIRILKRDYQFNFRNIFDTHRAAHLLGFQLLSLERMIKEFIGVELQKSKKIQRSRWDVRPLNEKQLEYAVQDVVYLPALYQKQWAELGSKGLRESAWKAFQAIARADWKEKRFDSRRCAKVKGYESLSAKQKKIFEKMCYWRFHRARDENRAVFLFLSDETLLAMARDYEHPERYLSQRKMRRYGQEVRQLVESLCRKGKNELVFDNEMV